MSKACLGSRIRHRIMLSRFDSLSLAENGNYGNFSPLGIANTPCNETRNDTGFSLHTYPIVEKRDGLSRDGSNLFFRIIQIAAAVTLGAALVLSM